MPIFFDIETVPHFENAAKFGIEPPVDAGAPADYNMDPRELLSGPISTIASVLETANASPEYLDSVEEAERRGNNRQGVFGALASIRKQRVKAATAHADYIKLLSTTPELCRIVALGWAVDEGETKSILAVNPDKEERLLWAFWRLVETKELPLVGYNCLGFDLAVIKVRSMMLDVPAPVIINDSPYSGNKDVIDLYLRRFGTRGNTSSKKPGKMKDLAGIYGIEVPSEACGGSVYELSTANPAMLKSYVESDVTVTRAMFRKMLGYFF